MKGAAYDFAQNTLEVLSIKGTALPLTLESMVMHRLRVLSLVSHDRPWSFLANWQLPVLEELQIAANPYDRVTGLASSTFPALRKIEWIDSELHPAPTVTWENDCLLLGVLVASPELQRFRISSRNTSIGTYFQSRRKRKEPADHISPFLATDDATGTPVYCPNLRELWVPEAGLFQIERLAELRPQLEKLKLFALGLDPVIISLKRKIYPTLLPTSPRWVHLTITPLLGANEPSSDPKILQRLFDAPIPQLRSLSVRGLGKWVDSIFDIGTVFRRAPRLVELEWHDRFVVFRPDDEETGNAEEYVRFKSLQGGIYDLAQNTLEVLSIQGTAPPITVESMVMRRLRFLLFGISCKPWSFLERWELPVLQELHLSGDPFDEVEAVGTFVPPTFPSLQRIEWSETRSDPTRADTETNDVFLGRVLAASPELRSIIFTRDSTLLPYLVVRRTHGPATHHILPFLEPDDATGAPRYCPNLQELRLQEAGFDELERLAEFRPRLEKVGLIVLRRDYITSPPLKEGWTYQERVKGRVEVIFHEGVSTSS
ncbi:hypothetical protein FRC01_000713 [Tulasnella sp. 417]|nr:hypothetical protein FRC01_000713 [Tulasnella sp. 417]